MSPAGLTAAVLFVPLSRRTGSNRVVTLACVLSLLLAVLALTGWFARLPVLASLLPERSTMKANTALCVLLLSLGICIASPRARIGVWIAGTLAAVTGLQGLLGQDFGIDQWLVADPWTAPERHPGRMSQMAVLALGAIAVGALLPPHPAGSRLRRLAPLPAALAFLIGYVGSIGLMFGADWQGSALDSFATFSVPTSASVMLLGAALLQRQSWRGSVLDEWASSTAGGRFMRAVLPMAALAPVLVVWVLLVAQRAHRYSADAALALAAALIAALFSFIVWRAARWINGIESELQLGRAQLEARVAERTAALSDAVGDLQARQHQLAAVVESATAGIITIDAEQRILLFNRAAEAMFGVDAHRMIGEPLDRLLPERYRRGHHENVARFARTGVSRREMGRTSALFGLRASGEEFPLEASISQVEVGRQRLLTVVLRDLSAERALAAERQARAVAESASRAKSEFVSRVSHELRTPLNAVIGFSQLLKMSRPEVRAAEHRAWADHIHRAGEHLLRMINDLLDLSRIEAGAVQIELRPVELRELLGACCGLMQAQSAARSVRLQLHAPDRTVPRVLADPARLQQVLLNLLSNAVKYNREAGEVQVWAEADDEVRIHVRDTGEGLGAEQRARLFEPFNRLGRENGHIEGTGIGLALSRQLVERMGGRIEVSSEPGVGSRFSVVLRAAAPA